MNIDSLRIFINFVDNKCDVSSCEKNGIVRASLWYHLKAIENEVGKQLVIRTRKLNILSAEGHAFLPYAREILEKYEAAILRISNQSEVEISGNIKIATTAAVASSWLMPSISTFRALYPNLSVNITALDDMDKATLNTADILLRPLNERQKEEFSIIWHICYHHGLFASQEYLDKNGIPQTSEDLCNHSMLAYGDHEFNGFEDINWHIKGRWHPLPRLNPSLTINSTLSLTNAAKAGLGICSLPTESNSIFQYNLVRVLPQIKGPTIKSYFAIKNNLSEARYNASQAFGDFFRENLHALKIQTYEN